MVAVPFPFPPDQAPRVVILFFRPVQTQAAYVPFLNAPNRRRPTLISFFSCHLFRRIIPSFEPVSIVLAMCGFFWECHVFTSNATKSHDLISFSLIWSGG